MRVYLSGPMTSMPDLNRHAFNAAEKWLTAQGHFVINPHRIGGLFGTAEDLAESFAEYYRMLDLDANFFNHTPATQILERTRIARAVMDADITAVRSCDAIYLLRGWETSRGAKKELTEAIACKLQVMLEDEAAPVEQTEAQETTTEATCPRGETTNMGWCSTTTEWYAPRLTKCAHTTTRRKSHER